MNSLNISYKYSNRLEIHVYLLCINDFSLPHDVTHTLSCDTHLTLSTPKVTQSHAPGDVVITHIYVES